MPTATFTAPTAAPQDGPGDRSFNKEDRAIVVGIDIYPGFVNRDLKASCADATDFRTWLTKPAPAGGGVLPNQAKLILSSDYPGPFASAFDARPAYADLERELMQLNELARNNQREQGSLRVGRRLYLYFSGHGCAPAIDESALFSADASPDSPAFHIAGKAWSHIFQVRGYFDEVILLMDCCRETFPTIKLRDPPLVELTADRRAVDRGRRVCLFATRWSRTTKELPIPDDDNRLHGVFTYALLQGLSGKAADPGTGLITAASLGLWLTVHMKEYVPANQWNDPDVSIRPDPHSDFADAQQVVLASVKPATKRFSIAIPAVLVGGPVELLDGALNFLHSLAVAPPVWDIQLLPGLYLVQRPGGADKSPFIVDRS
jgi:hypothetical protein